MSKKTSKAKKTEAPATETPLETPTEPVVEDVPKVEELTEEAKEIVKPTYGEKEPEVKEKKVAVGEATGDLPVPKKRGRPKKVVVEGEVKEKKKMGRPKKVPSPKFDTFDMLPKTSSSMEAEIMSSVVNGVAKYISAQIDSTMFNGVPIEIVCALIEFDTEFRVTLAQKVMEKMK